MLDLSGVKLERCLDCGKCTSICPVARYNHTLSPRRLVRRGLAGQVNGEADAVWACLTCMRCDSVCPQEVTISRLLPRLRETVRANGGAPPNSRCGALDAVMVLQSQAPLEQNRLDWLPDDIETDPQSKTLMWVGCAPYFDAFYADNGVETTAAVVAAIRILNALGIKPAVRADERCCGHDALWGGDDATFERLAEMNRKMFAEAEPELVVTTCPECALTLDREYRERFGVPAGEVKHIAQIIAENKDRLPLDQATRKDATRKDAFRQVVTFSDPCRLGRHAGEYEAPRTSLKAVPGLELKELPRHRQRATCCAGSFLSCNQASKRIQLDLLGAAAATGAETLVTACPKCLIHLSCAQRIEGDQKPAIAIRDLATIVAGALTGSADAQAAASSAEERG